MREIKFKALTNSNLEVTGYYVYDEHLNLHYIDTGKGVRIQIKRETLRQYTGLKDKNETEIYEGDVVKERDYLYLIGFGEFTIIEDDMRMLGFYIEALKEEKIKILDKEMTMRFPIFEDACKEVEVIGNIYEKPELLESEV